jgi:hypothetical protein
MPKNLHDHWAEIEKFPTRMNEGLFPQKIITGRIRGSIHIATTKLLLDLKISNNKIQKLHRLWYLVSRAVFA